MNRYKKPLLLLLVTLGVAAVVLYFGRKTPISASPTLQSSQKLNTTLSISGKSFDISQFVGKSALAATQQVADIKTTGLGESTFVASINGVVADSKKHEFWELVINGQTAQVGAGSYTIQKGDSILWRLSTY